MSTMPSTYALLFVQFLVIVTVLGKGCRICEQEYLSLFPALAISYYANLKGLKVELGSDRLFGIALDVYIPLEQVAIQVNTDSEKIDILKEHLCKQRGIKLIKLPMKPNEAEPEYAQRIKAAFQSVHIFILMISARSYMRCSSFTTLCLADFPASVFTVI